MMHNEQLVILKESQFELLGWEGWWFCGVQAGIATPENLLKSPYAHLRVTFQLLFYP